MHFLILLTMFAVLGWEVETQTATSPPDTDGARAQDVEDGKRFYVEYGCYQCHGYEAQGGPGGRLAPSPLALDAFSRYVRQPIGEMPPYTSNVLSDQQLEAIYRFLLSIPEPPAVETIPLLNDD